MAEERIQLSKKIVFLFGGVRLSFKDLGTTNVCKMVAGHSL